MLEHRVDELVDPEGDVGVGLVVELPVYLVEEGHDEPAEDLEEEGIAEVGQPRGFVLEMQGKEGLQVDERQLRNNLEGFVPVDGLDDAGDVVHVAAEGLAGARVDAGAYQLVDLVYVIDGLSVDPNHRDDVEEDPPFGEGLRRHEDSRPHRTHQLLHNAVVYLKCPSVVLLEMYVDGLEELQRVVDHLSAVVREVGDADVDDVHNEGFEARLGELLDVEPEASGRYALVALTKDHLREGFQVAKRGQGIALACELVVLEDDPGLAQVGLSFGQELRAQVQPHYPCSWMQSAHVQVLEQLEVAIQRGLEDRQQVLVQLAKVLNFGWLVGPVLLQHFVHLETRDLREGYLKHLLAMLSVQLYLIFRKLILAALE